MVFVRHSSQQKHEDGGKVVGPVQFQCHRVVMLARFS